jgi:hypothetical protein
MLKLPFCCIVFMLLCSLGACNSTKNSPLDIDFSRDSTSIVIKNIDPVGMAKIKNGELGDSLLQELVTVLESPLAEDTAGMQLQMPGKVLPAGDALIFQPGRPFEKGRKYMVLTYINSKFADFQSIIKSKTKFNMAPNQKVLEFL